MLEQGPSRPFMCGGRMGENTFPTKLTNGKKQRSGRRRKCKEHCKRDFGYRERQPAKHHIIKLFVSNLQYLSY